MPHKLLLADDSVTIQRVVELTFADEDIDVIMVGDGAHAIEAVIRDAPDIVLADTSMPEKDGYEVAAFIKSDATRAHIPVVLLTGAFEPLDELRAETIGADGVLVKPFEPQQVIEKVRELLAAAAAATPPVIEPEPVLPATQAQPAPAPDESPAESASPSVGTVGEGELADYFDQLDEAFASLESQITSPTVPALEPRAAPPEPVAPVEAGAVAAQADVDRLDLEGFVEVAARADAEPTAAVPAGPEAAPEADCTGGCTGGYTGGYTGG